MNARQAPTVVTRVMKNQIKTILLLARDAA